MRRQRRDRRTGHSGLLRQGCDQSGTSATRLDLANWIVSRETRSPPVSSLIGVACNSSALAYRKFSRIWVRKANGRPIPSCSTGWPPSSCGRTWKAAGVTCLGRETPVRTIVTSHTYRQSSLSNPQLEERDPENRLLARQSRFRVDAEIRSRHRALGLRSAWSRSFGGPSVRPYQPEGYLRGDELSEARVFGEPRRGSLPPRRSTRSGSERFCIRALLTFDAPTREECTVNRVNSNTPLQALVLLNDPDLCRSGPRVCAEHALRDGEGSFDRQLDWAFPAH